MDKNEDSIPSENGNKEEIVYLLSNQAIPEWIKIGRTNSINRRLKELYNTSVPLPFDLVEYILVASTSQSIELEKNIHSILDTINPDLRKSTDAYKREFFKMSIDDGKKLFNLVSRIMALQSNKLSSNASSIS